jgi:hypothetical protein
MRRRGSPRDPRRAARAGPGGSPKRSERCRRLSRRSAAQQSASSGSSWRLRMRHQAPQRVRGAPAPAGCPRQDSAQWPHPRRRPPTPRAGRRSRRCPTASRPRQAPRQPRGAASWSSTAEAAHELREPRCRPRPAPPPAGTRRRRGRSRLTARVPGPRHPPNCRLLWPLLGASSPHTSSISSSGRTGRQSRAARAASSACGRSPATGLPRQRTSASRVRAMLT